MSARFQVVTVSGYLDADVRAHGNNPGLSATVVDTAYAHREIVTYRTEDEPHRPGASRSRSAEVLRKANRDAAMLNATADP